MLELMEVFFKNRLAGYDEHMHRDIPGAAEFYPATAALLPDTPGCRVLDLGCGTGLELEDYFPRNPTARVTGIDVSPEMLAALRAKFPGRNLDLRCGSYLKSYLGEAEYDAAVSVESLHHFPAETKLDLYRRLHAALKPGGYFVLTDYFAGDDGQEAESFRALEDLRRQEGLDREALVHYDTPLTRGHELALLREAGFTPEVLRTWGATGLIRAAKE